MDENEKIDKLRLLVQEAENTGNLTLMASILGEDITAIVPGTPVIKGKEAAVAFLKSWFDSTLISIAYQREAIEVKGDLAYEWATYQQETTDKKTGAKASETGRILWIYKKIHDHWFQHFIIWNTL